MSFTRLSRGDVLAAVAALALLVSLSLNWYTTTEGRDLRRVEQATAPADSQAGEVSRFTDREADRIADNAEQTAWQADEGIDRVILVVLLAAALLATAAAWLRAAKVDFTPPFTPSAAASLVGLAGSLLVAFRIAQKPASDASAVILIGAPIGLICVGLLALGARFAWQNEVALASPPGDAADAETEDDDLGADALWADWDESDADGDEDTAERDALKLPPSGQPGGG